MIVCSCHRLTDRDIRRAHGPEGPGHTPAGTGCGNCLPLVSEITRECRRDRSTEGLASDPREEREAPRGLDE